MKQAGSEVSLAPAVLVIQGRFASDQRLKTNSSRLTMPDVPGS
jgi:hypothetical protein